MEEQHLQRPLAILEMSFKLKYHEKPWIHIMIMIIIIIFSPWVETAVLGGL